MSFKSLKQMVDSWPIEKTGTKNNICKLHTLSSASFKKKQSSLQSFREGAKLQDTKKDPRSTALLLYD